MVGMTRRVDEAEHPAGKIEALTLGGGMTRASGTGWSAPKSRVKASTP